MGTDGANRDVLFFPEANTGFTLVSGSLGWWKIAAYNENLAASMALYRPSSKRRKRTRALWWPTPTLLNRVSDANSLTQPSESSMGCPTAPRGAMALAHTGSLETSRV